MRRILLLAAALAAAAVGASLSAATEFIAIGDSVTAGSSWPVPEEVCAICPVEFDCSGSCQATENGRENCGHVRRLDDWIDGWMGPGDHVRNLGLGGERTSEAVSRIASDLTDNCGTPGDCNAVILMHGTNDMAGSVSPESATANLGFMIGEAKSRNIDTLLMTVIRKGDNPGHAKWASYKDLVLALAVDENLQSVNPWLPLCPNSTCTDQNYWVPGGQSPQCSDTNATLDPGHLDRDGYDVLTGLIQAKFPGSTPAAPTPTAPTGDITDTSPDFVWNEAPGARWYALDVDGGVTWWEAAEHCAGGVCTVNPGGKLSKTAHLWKVRGRNLRGLGSWSGDTPFEIWGVPGTPAPMDPDGLFVDATPQAAPYAWEPFRWSEEPEATDYDLQVSDGGGSVYTDSFTSASCAASVCTGAPGQGLDAGEYTWTVQARNPGATGPVSAPLAFEVWDQVPEEPVPTEPTGDWFEFAPLYEWLPAKGAEEYDVEVRDAAMNLDDGATGLAAAAVCSGGVCSWQGAALTVPDDYSLKVKGRNAAGDGPLSSTGADFTILVCADQSEEDLSVLEPSPVTTAKTVPHCGPVTAASGGLYTVEASGILTVITRDGFTAYNDFSVLGELTIRTP